MHKSKIFLYVIYLLSNIVYSQISVDTETYSIEELVTEVLVNNSCDAISNITYSSSSTYYPEESISYFTNNDLSNFPFSSGILLSTGFAENAEGPNVYANSDGGGLFPLWVGDDQLFNYIEGLGIDNNLGSHNNSSSIEFDFIPLENFISFNFVFASEEYGMFQCIWSDAFAFFLTDATTQETTNLALVPNSNTPISVITIRDNEYNSNCSSENSEYFNNYYPAFDNNSPHDFNGDTKVFTAQSDVIPGRSYHIKLVIADRNDGDLDSIVFLKEGSFDLTGVELGEDFTLDNGTAICDEDYLLSLSLEDYESIQWFKDGVLIDGENGEEITISESGTYSVEVVFSNIDCVLTDEIIIEFTNESLENPENIQVQSDDCSQDFEGIIDLNVRGFEYLGLNEDDYSIEYYPTQEDAENQTNIIGNPEAYLITNPNQQIFIRVEFLVLGCTTFVNFGFDVNPSTINISSVEKNFCLNNSLYTVQLQDYDIDYTNQFNGDLIITYYSSLEDAENNTNPIDPIEVINLTESTTFYVLIETTSNIICTVITTLVLTENDTVIIPTIPDLEVCDLDSNLEEIIAYDYLQDYVNTYILNSNNYQLFSTEEDALNNENPLLNDFTQNSIVKTYYIRIINPDDCYSIGSFIIELLELPSLDVAVQNASICTLENAVFIISDYDITFDYSYILNNQTFEISTPTFEVLEINETFTIEVNVLNPITGCTNQVIVEQEVNDFPEVNSIENNFCLNNSALDYTVQLQDYNSEYNSQTNEELVILYFYSNADAENNINPINPTEVLNINTTTIFYVLIGINEELVCTEVITLTLNALDIVVNPEIFDLEICDNSNDRQEIIALNYLQNYINSYVSGLNDYQIFITEQDAIQVENPLLNDYIQNSTIQTYYIRISNADDCYTISNFDISFIEAPPLNVEVYNNTICFLEDAIFTITDYNDSYTYNYVFSNQTYTITEATFYILEATETFTLEVNVTNPLTGCTNQKFIEQIVNAYPQIYSLVPLEQDGFEVIYTANQPVEFSINGIDWQTSPIFNGLDSEIYEVQIRLIDFLCYGNTQEIFLYVINNVITPNGDGINDYFYLPAIQNDPTNERALSVQIFDRYGKLITEHNSKTEGFKWDGTYLGRPVPSSSYWYIIKLPDGRNYKGSITVKNK